MAFKKTLLPLFFFTALLAYGQQEPVTKEQPKDSVRNVKTIVDSLSVKEKADSIERLAARMKLQLISTDTLIERQGNRLDSISGKVNGIVVPVGLKNRADSLGKLSVPARHKAYRFKKDTLQHRVDSLTHQINISSLNDSLSVEKLKDNISIRQPGDTLSGKWKNLKDSLANNYDPRLKLKGLQGNLDTLQRKPINTLSARVKRKLSGLSTKKDSLNTITEKPGKAISGVQDQVGNKVNKISDLPGEGADKLGGVDPSDKINKTIAVPETGLALPEVVHKDIALDQAGIGLPAKSGLPGLSTGIDGELAVSPDVINITPINDLTEDIDLADSALPEINGELEEFQPGIDLNQEIKEVTDIDIKNSVKEPLEDIKGNIDNPMNELEDHEMVGEAKEKVADVKTVNADLEGISSDIKSAKEGDSEALEKRVAEHVDLTDDLDKFKQQQKEMTELQVSYEDKLKVMREMQDQEVFKKKLEEALKKEVPNYFEGKEQQLLEAQKVLATYKKKYSEVASIKELPSGNAQAIQNVRFADRLMLGADLEFVRSDINFLDAAPYIGYKLTRRWHLKAGYSWRFNVSIEDGLEVRTHNGKGLRTSINFEIHKGFMAVAGYERTQVDITPVSPGEKPPKWADMAVFGIRKRYRIIRSLYGDGQVLYNFSLNGENGFDQRVNLRFGVFLDFRSR